MVHTGDLDEVFGLPVSVLATVAYWKMNQLSEHLCVTRYFLKGVKLTSIVEMIQ